MVGILGLVLLFVAIIYTGRQVNIYLRMRKRLGKLILALSPSNGQKKLLVAGAAGFVLLLILVTFSYMNAGVELGGTYTALVAVVLFSAGRMISNIVELREEAMIGQLNEIGYKDIKHYSFLGEGRRQRVKFQLMDGREFISLISEVDKDALKTALEKKVR